MNDFRSRLPGRLILVGILIVGIVFRVTGINWDSGYHLHPDERFLTMVANAEKLSSDWLYYFIPSLSSLNPYNVGFPFFVYGTFPLTIAKIVAVFLNRDTYDAFTILGRWLSAFADICIILLVYKIVFLWEKKYRLDHRIKFFASFFYAVSVLPVQLSHFFAVDTFLSLFMIGSFYFALRFHLHQSLRNMVTSAIFFGLAMGSKITALFILPLILFFLLFPFLKKKQWRSLFGFFVLFLGVSYLMLRIADPKFFALGNFFDPQINPIFIQNLKTLSASSNKDLWFPPSIQWISKKPVIFALTNIIFFGLGLPLFVLMCIGSYFSARKKKVEIYIVLGWIIIFFLYQSSRYAASLRYFIFLYPFFAILAGFGFSYLYKWSAIFKKKVFYSLVGVIMILVLVWPVSFLSIYRREHSRVAASQWIKSIIPQTAYLAEEHWDDFLPVDGGYAGSQMPVFGEDTPEKWREINATLEKADYYIMTSNRGYGSILTVPEKYPLMSRFYMDLFAGNVGFQKVAEFTSYPSIPLGFMTFEFPDDWAEEAFTVYDHPKVTIFQKTRPWIPYK